MLLDDLPQHLVDIAMSDGNFIEIYKNYTRKMVEMSEFYGMSIQELSEITNMTDEEAQALQDNLQAEQDRQLDEIRKMNQSVVDKINSKLAAQISAYGDDLPNVIRNLNDSLALQGRNDYIAMSATDLFNFLKATVPDVTLNTPDPGPPFVYDPTKVIDTKPSKNYATESLSAARKIEIKVRAELLGATITDSDRRRIIFEVENPGREYVDENTRQNEIDNAQRLGISINAWRRLEERRKAQEQEKVDAIVAQRMGISVEDLIRIRTVNTAPDQDYRDKMNSQKLPITKPDEPRSYTDSEIEDLFSEDVKMYSYYMSREDAIKKTREMQYQKELMEIRDRPGSGYGNNIYEVPDDPLELQREQGIVDARNAADQAAADRAAADKAAADAAAAESNAPQNAQAPATPAPNIA
jgi:transcriptional regulator with XRE-family HTH domain